MLAAHCNKGDFGTSRCGSPIARLHQLREWAEGASPTFLLQLLAAVLGPTLPSSTSAPSGSYLGISCRQQRRSTTVEDDPRPSFPQAPSCNYCALASYS